MLPWSLRSTDTRACFSHLSARVLPEAAVPGLLGHPLGGLGAAALPSGFLVPMTSLGVPEGNPHPLHCLRQEVTLPHSHPPGRTQGVHTPMPGAREEERTQTRCVVLDTGLILCV